MAHEFLIEETQLVKSGIQYNDIVSDMYAWYFCDWTCVLHFLHFYFILFYFILFYFISFFF
jgi:hypothetical protein